MDMGHGHGTWTWTWNLLAVAPRRREVQAWPAALHPSAWEWAHAHADVLETHNTRGQPANPGEKTSRPKRDQDS